MIYVGTVGHLNYLSVDSDRLDARVKCHLRREMFMRAYLKLPQSTSLFILASRIFFNGPKPHRQKLCRMLKNGRNIAQFQDKDQSPSHASTLELSLLNSADRRLCSPV
ncbi:hypothetical protein BaRGS_00013901 [Batillaria attramentaria]|uniref:Uncharacterized protein n=1 Tax=Batillaria attramentaria TaxID=370345 RepID=A0ABD0L5B7_9CAEN